MRISKTKKKKNQIPNTDLCSCSMFDYRYLRLPIQEVTGPIIDSSNERHETFCRLGVPKTKIDAINMLGDQSGKVHTVFRENGGDEFIKTVAMGE